VTVHGLGVGCPGRQVVTDEWSLVLVDRDVADWRAHHP